MKMYVVRTEELLNPIYRRDVMIVVQYVDRIVLIIHDLTVISKTVGLIVEYLQATSYQLGLY